MRKYIDGALKILTKVFDEGSYSNRALSTDKTSDMTTKLVYGVLERDIEIQWVLSALVKKQPKGKIQTLLKIGTYALLHLDNVPNFAIVSECVEVAKANGLKGQSGFVNAVLKKIARREFSMPTDKKQALSVKYSLPIWFIDRLYAEYDKEDVDNLLSNDVGTDECIRINSKCSVDDVKARLDKDKIKYSDGEYNTIFASANSKAVRDMFNSGWITFQALSSMKAVFALGLNGKSEILDMCSAPGGKAVLIGELSPESTITACDLHKHRVELIDKYAKRMGVENINPMVNDATKFRKEWAGKFDYVLVDAPCSCFGTYKKHPDVFLNRSYSHSIELAKIQKTILENAINYTEKGGIIVYSTCTLFDVENIDVVRSVLDKAELVNFECDGLPNDKSYVRLLPSEGSDGFFIARLRKI